MARWAMVRALLGQHVYKFFRARARDEANGVDTADLRAAAANARGTRITIDISHCDPLRSGNKQHMVHVHAALRERARHALHAPPSLLQHGVEGVAVLHLKTFRSVHGAHSFAICKESAGESSKKHEATRGASGMEWRLRQTRATAARGGGRGDIFT